ncbi:MAG: hypothetical protein ACFFCS_26505 [Candidatus Hodarchaeota archaeon]
MRSASLRFGYMPVATSVSNISRYFSGRNRVIIFMRVQPLSCMLGRFVVVLVGLSRVSNGAVGLRMAVTGL